MVVLTHFSLDGSGFDEDPDRIAIGPQLQASRGSEQANCSLERHEVGWTGAQSSSIDHIGVELAWAMNNSQEITARA